MEQKEQKLVIFLAGELRNSENVRRLIENHNFDFYAADGGYRIAQKFDLPLKKVFGDFDSTDAPDIPDLIRFPCEKDQTDSEIALDLAIEDGYTSIWMIAPFGGRLDHTMANLNLLENAFERNVDLKLYDGENLAFILPKGTHTIDNSYQYVSFFPLNATAEISLDGFKYPLKQATILRKKPLAISNESQSEHPTIQIHSQPVYCICIE